MTLNPAVRDYLSEVGRKGGQSKTPHKLRSASANLEKARARRWKKDVTITNTEPEKP